jgi:hypothetical protein
MEPTRSVHIKPRFLGANEILLQSAGFFISCGSVSCKIQITSYEGGATLREDVDMAP